METKVTKLLDEKGIDYRLLVHDNPALTCEAAAKDRGVPISEMIKCILLVDKKKNYFLACLPGNKKLIPQKVRDVVGSSRLSFATPEEVEQITGYKIGYISPLCLKEEVLITFDNSLKSKQKVSISAGDPMAGVELSPKPLIELVQPRFADITE